jgi:Undecaprenyl-phosphate galactose phosphotransferase WbaP
MVADYGAILCAEKISFVLRNILVPDGGQLYISWLVFFVICPFIYIIFLHINGIYTKRMQYWLSVKEIFKTNIYIMVTLIVFMYIVHIAGTTSRLFIFLLGVFSFFFIIIFRFLMKLILDKSNILRVPILIMGAGKTADLVLQELKNDIGLGYYFVGFLEDNVPDKRVAATIPQLGRFSDAKRIITEMNVAHVLVIAPGMNASSIQDLVYSLQPLVKEIAFIPDMGKMPLATLDIESLVDGHIVVFKIRNNLSVWHNEAFKFCFDIAVTFIGTILIFPVLVFIGLWIYLDSPGPIIFRHARIGKNGREFYCYKFRTMCVDADDKLKKLLATDHEAQAEWEKDFKLKNDPRITKSGDFLRKTSLDELPQIFNVLKGEMSLVGPRPIVEAEVVRYGKYIADYYMVRPGITGIWQTSGRSDVTYDERVQMDTWYVRNWNIWLDIILLWRTFKVVIDKKGAY